MDKIATLELYKFSKLTDSQIKNLIEWLKDVRKDIKTRPSNYDDKMKYNLFR